MSPATEILKTGKNITENEMILNWWTNFYRKSSNSSAKLPATEDPVTLHNLKVVVLLLVGCTGTIIVGCLLFWMFYKNERILQTIPGTKEHKRRKREEEYFYPIPNLGTIRKQQDKTLALLANPKLLGSGIAKPGRIKTAKAKPTIATLYTRKESREAETERDCLEAENTQQEKNNDNKSDVSSLHESDGLEEYDSPDNTFPAGGEMEAKKKGSRKRRELKRVKRLKKKNQFSTTVVTKGATPSVEELSDAIAAEEEDDIVQHNDVTYMSRF